MHLRNSEVPAVLSVCCLGKQFRCSHCSYHEKRSFAVPVATFLNPCTDLSMIAASYRQHNTFRAYHTVVSFADLWALTITNQIVSEMTIVMRSLVCISAALQPSASSQLVKQPATFLSLYRKRPQWLIRTISVSTVSVPLSTPQVLMNKTSPVSTKK